MPKVYIVQGLGLGDDEDAWEVMRAYATQASANKFVAEQQAEYPGLEFCVQETALHA